MCTQNQFTVQMFKKPVYSIYTLTIDGLNLNNYNKIGKLEYK